MTLKVITFQVISLKRKENIDVYIYIYIYVFENGRKQPQSSEERLTSQQKTVKRMTKSKQFLMM